jgi:2-polyprenyl-6-hydroxyphenyl methylase/3-demethylubiquinone-9 3-methyltransferase
MIKKLIDYGGGFGTLARMIAQKNPGLQIDIFEPNPTEYALAKCRKFRNIRFISSMNEAFRDKYDCLVSTDVLEHLPDPLRNLGEMISFVDINRYLLIANNFHPVIKCHLPSTFHFRYTFNLFTRMMGLKRQGPCRGSHAIIYKKIANRSPNWIKFKNLEKLSKKTFPVLSKMGSLYSALKLRLNKKYLHQLT